MKAAEYRKYIDMVTHYAATLDMKVYFDLHGAPGGQNGATYSGCVLHKDNDKSAYWDTTWNKKWTLAAFKEMA